MRKASCIQLKLCPWLVASFVCLSALGCSFKSNTPENNKSTDLAPADKQVQNKEQQQPSEEPQSTKLTAEQRAAWERRRAQAKKGELYVYAISGIAKPVWKSANCEKTLGNTGWIEQCRCDESLIGYAYTDKEKVYVRGYTNDPVIRITAHQAAYLVAREPATQYAVIVDLFTEKNPIALGWYRSTGGEVKEVQSLPAAIRDSFSRHMLRVQQTIGD
jgi:hypothetical protein